MAQPATPSLSLPKVLVLMDVELPRAKQKQILTWAQGLRTVAQVEVITDEMSEAQLIERIQSNPPDFTFIPWKLYIKSRKLEITLGAARTQGPSVCAYSNEMLSFSDFPEAQDRSRVLWLDLLSLAPTDALLIARAMIDPRRRSGLKPLLRAGTPIYCDTWTGSDVIGPRIEALLAVPGIKDSEWARRIPAIRICLESLWSLIFELGPLKGDLAKALAAKIPKAYFQFAVDTHCICFRLCYTRANSVPIGVLNAFRPRLGGDLHAPAVLNQFSDLLRIHAIADTQDLEITVLLFPTAPSERFSGGLRSLWIEPLSPSIVSEPIYEEPGPQSPQLKRLLAASTGASSFASAFAPAGAPTSGTRIMDGAERERVKEILTKMKAELQARDHLIRDLKAGGVGTLAPSSPLKVEELVETLSLRTQEQLETNRSLEARVQTLSKTAPFSAEMDALKRQLTSEREKTQGMIQTLAQILSKLTQRVPVASNDPAPLPSSASGEDKKKAG